MSNKEEAKKNIALQQQQYTSRRSRHKLAVRICPLHQSINQPINQPTNQNTPMNSEETEKIKTEGPKEESKTEEPKQKQRRQKKKGKRSWKGDAARRTHLDSSRR